jgi:hypothetical protein
MLFERNLILEWRNVVHSRHDFVKMSSRVKIALHFPCQPSREHGCAYELPRIGKVEDFRDG